MSSPNPPHTIKVEALLGGAWTDITTDLYQRAGISIRVGATGEQGVIQPASATFVLANLSPGFKYSPYNANSVYYGQFVKGAQVRISAAGTNYRFNGQIVSIRPRADLSQNDLYVEVECGAVLRRLGQGTAPAQSTARAWIPTTSPTAFWPLEDGVLSVSGRPVAGPYALKHMGTLAQGWGKGTLAAWLPPTLQGVMSGSVNGDDARFAAPVSPQGSSIGWALDYYVNGATDYAVTVSHSPTLGSTDAWILSMTASTSNILVTPPAGSTGGGSTAYVHDGKFHHVRFQVIENFIGDANYFVAIDGVVAATGHVTATSPEPVIDVLRIEFDLSDHQPASANSTRNTIGYVAYYANTTTPPSLITAVAVAFGRVGEAEGDRVVRLCSENSITLATIGTSSATPPLGPQGNDTLLNLLTGSVNAGGGLLFESLTALGLVYATRDSLYNQTVALTLDHSALNQLAQPLAPPDDDQLLRNDVTVTRNLGGSERNQKTTGVNSIAAVGQYDTSVTVNVLSQAQALDQAGWRVWIGTYAGARFPAVYLNMSILPLAQRTNVLALLVGSRIQITNSPRWVSYDTIDLLVLGWAETLNTFDWFITLVCVPYVPYLVAKADDAVLARPSPVSSTVTCTAGATSWSVATSLGPLWTTNAADFPFDVGVEGERVTVTNITGAASPQTFTVTRAVNGVSKAHTAAVVDEWQLMIAGM